MHLHNAPSSVHRALASDLLGVVVRDGVPDASRDLLPGVAVDEATFVVKSGPQHAQRSYSLNQLLEVVAEMLLLRVDAMAGLPSSEASHR
jgi:hypothetical protein